MPNTLAYRRKHALLLVQRLLSFRAGVSPLTVILDSLGQSSRPIVRECIARAKPRFLFWVALSNKVRVVFLAFDTISAPQNTDVFLPGCRKDLSTLRREVKAAIGSSATNLLVIDNVHPLLSLSQDQSLPAILTSLASSPGTSLLLTCHADSAIPSTIPSNHYTPGPLRLLTHFATSVIIPSALSHAHAAHEAALRSLPPPAHGLGEDIDGVIIGLGANGGGPRLEGAPWGMGRGIVLDIEHRRRSGRGTREKFFLATGEEGSETCKAAGKPSGEREGTTSNEQGMSIHPISLLDDHPCFLSSTAPLSTENPEDAAETFNLSLTDRQRADRAGVVLPYYDAQRIGNEGSVGSGGRILYQMGVEDAGDWDSEEDEL